MKNYSVFCLFICLVVFSGCFQPVDLGETVIEKATAHIQVTNVSADEDYVLDGLELRNAEGEVEQSWDGLNLGLGKSWEVHAKTSGSCTLWYRVKDLWISSSVIGEPYQTDPPAKIALNRSYEFSFKGEDLDIKQQDNDQDGVPDAWELENGFNPEDPADGSEVYVSRVGEDESGRGNGTSSSPYRTLAKALAKAGRGLNPRARTVVVLGTLDWWNGNDHLNQEYPGREDSIFCLGKTRNPVTIRPEDPANLSAPGVLTGELDSGDTRRVLYLGPGADIVLLNMKITKGRQTGGGVYASGARLTLGSGTTITGNESYDLISGGSGGLYMENGVLVMEPGSSVDNNNAYIAGGVQLRMSRFTMKGGAITGNHAVLATGGLGIDGCTVEMFVGAVISDNTVGIAGDPIGDTCGGASMVFSEFTMHSGSQITDNTIFGGRGGGLYVSGESKLVMESGSVVSGNLCTFVAGDTISGQGGGLEVGGRSSFTMESGAVIAGNTAGQYGGGVFLGGSSFTMEGGGITGNTAGDYSASQPGYGGGVYVQGASSFTMEDGIIASNTAGTRGGGVYVVDTGSSFTMKRGTVYGKSPSEAAKKNVAGAEADTGTGHAVYDARSGASPQYLDGDISVFPVIPSL
jgi:hypothetical protein